MGGGNFSRCPSVIPPNVESDTIAKHLRGKCPGTRKANGKWVGTAGSLAERQMTLEEAETADRTEAVVGILGREFPALDVDTSLAPVVADVIELADRSTSWSVPDDAIGLRVRSAMLRDREP
jgi:hypothetical protein